MKVRKSLQKIYIKKSDLEGKHWVHYSGEVKVKTGVCGPPQWYSDMPHLAGEYIEYKAVRSVKAKKVPIPKGG